MLMSESDGSEIIVTVARSAVSETDSRPSESAFAVELDGRWYRLGNGGQDHDQATWNREVFVLLNQLNQMTVADVAKVPAVPITIAK